MALGRGPSCLDQACFLPVLELFMVFPVVMYGCESWTVKKALESPLDCKEIQPVPSEGDQPWDF